MTSKDQNDDALHIVHYADCPSCKWLFGIIDGDFSCSIKNEKMKSFFYMDQETDDPICRYFPFLKPAGLNERPEKVAVKKDVKKPPSLLDW